MIFAYFLGMCSYLAVSKTVKTSFGLGIAVVFVQVITVPVNYLLNKYVLSEGSLTWINPAWADLDLGFLLLIYKQKNCKKILFLFLNISSVRSLLYSLFLIQKHECNLITFLIQKHECN